MRDRTTTAASYTFALGLAVFLLFQSFTFQARKQASNELEITLESRDVPGYVYVPTLLLIGLALGVKVPPDLAARLLGSRSSGDDKN